MQIMNDENHINNINESGARLTLDSLSKSYGSFKISNLSLTLNAGQILCLLGPSGCGKTTLLRLIAGLDSLDKGTVWVNKQDVTHLPVHKRQFGMMFQDLALFPHKSVQENIAYGLQMSNQPLEKIRERTTNMLALVGLENMALRDVADLSGGEQQRVALARSLAPRPKLLMLDEPLGALDRSLREHLLQEIRRILRELQVTAIFVTHDQTEALTMGDVVGIMNQGQLMQLDSPQDLYLKPQHAFVARFLGFQNLLSGRVRQDGAVETELGILKGVKHQLEPEQQVTVVMRPELAKTDPVDSKAHHKLTGVVQERIFSGQQYRIKFKFNQDRILSFELPNTGQPPEPGQQINLWIEMAGIFLIPGFCKNQEIQ
jgi:ABC-type Fe3+/spermidine/putrescine transport system ATPase subunit